MMHCVVNCDVTDEEKLLEMKRKIQEAIYRWKIHSDVENSKKKEESDLVLDLVLNHLTPSELLTASLVNSNNWNKELGKCDNFNDKIVFKCNSSNLFALERTERHYSHLEITIKNSRWEIQSVERIIERFSPFLKTLKLIKFGGYNNIFNKPLSFPYLTKLEVHAVCGRISGSGWSEIKSLKKLIVNGVSEDGLMQCLMNNSQLEELVIYENSFISYFNKEISPSIQFSLKKLAIKDHYLTDLRLFGEFKAENWRKGMVKNFKRFLSTQTTLKSLHLDSCRACDIGKFILPSIEILELNSLLGDVDELRVPVANNVRVFLSDDENVYKIIDLMKHFGRLEVVYIKSLTIEMLITILRQTSFRLKRINYTSTYGKQDFSNIDMLCAICIENALGINQSSKEDFIHLFCQ